MRILLAEDEAVSRRLTELLLGKWGYDVVLARDGSEAWQLLQDADPPQIAVLDWLMPGVDGVELCRRVRARTQGAYTYLILLTSLAGEEHIVTAMDAGADDYLTKPFRGAELWARLRTGERIVAMENSRERLIAELRNALQRVRTLSGMVPICAGCKKIRDDKGYWSQVETYICQHSDVLFSHSLCPECAVEAYAQLDNFPADYGGSVSAASR